MLVDLSTNKIMKQAKKITNTMLAINPISAPIPLDFEALGLVSIHIRYKIKPNKGTKNPNTPHPTVFSSFIAAEAVAVGVYCDAPQFEQNEACSLISVPQF